MSRLPHASLNLLAAAVLAALPAAWAWAQQLPPWMQQGAPRERPQPQAEMPQRRDNLSDAVRRAERDTRGEVLSAERIQFDGRDMHRVKVVDDQGRVRVYMQDPARRGDGGRRPPVRDGGDD